MAAKKSRPVREKLGPAIPYGKGARRWTAKLTDLFPPNEALSATMVAVCVRCDEIRMCHGRISEIEQMEEAGETQTDSLWDPMLERMMLMRFSVVAAFDLADHAVALNKSKRFRDALAKNEQQRDLFASGYANLVKTIDSWRPFRNELFAHIDTKIGKPLPTTIERQGGGDAKGDVAVGKLRGDFAFPAAHFLLMMSMSTTPDWDEGFIEALKLLDRANAAALEILWPSLGAFETLTGSFLGKDVALIGWK